MTKPATTIHWCDTPATLRTDPPAGLQNTGFSAIMKLPAQYINAHLGRIWDWLAWLNTRIFDGYTIPTDGADCRVYGDPDEGIAVKNSSLDYLPVYCSTLNGNVAANYGLAANCYSCMLVPLSSAFNPDFGGTQNWLWSGGTPGDEILTSNKATANAVWFVQIPWGAKVERIAVDWKPVSAAPGTKMCMTAYKMSALPLADGADAPALGALSMLSTTKIEAQASTNRKWGILTPDQNNTDLENSGRLGGLPDESAVSFLRIQVTSSSEASADFVYGVYVVVKHKSLGHLAPAPPVTS